MPCTADYLNDLVVQKKALANSLKQKGVAASESETLNTLIPKLDKLSEQAKRDFADILQNFGERNVYTSMFLRLPNIEIIRYFNYDLNCRMCESMFGFCATDTTLYPDGLDLTEFLKECGISLVWGNTGILKSSSMFASSRITRVPPLFLSSINTTAYVFENCSMLKTIDGLKFDGQANSTSFFKNCSSLENITFNGKWQAYITLSDSPLLTRASMLSLFSAMADYSLSSSGKSATLGSVNLAKLSDADKAIATQKNWTLT